MRRHLPLLLLLLHKSRERFGFAWCTFSSTCFVCFLAFDGPSHRRRRRHNFPFIFRCHFIKNFSSISCKQSNWIESRMSDLNGLRSVQSCHSVFSYNHHLHAVKTKETKNVQIAVLWSAEIWCIQKAAKKAREKTRKENSFREVKMQQRAESTGAERSRAKK